MAADSSTEGTVNSCVAFMVRAISRMKQWHSASSMPVFQGKLRGKAQRSQSLSEVLLVELLVTGRSEPQHRWKGKVHRLQRIL